MDVVVGIIWGVVLDHPVHFGEVQAALGDICAEEDSTFSLEELQVSAGALLLLLLAMNVAHLDVNVVQQVAVKFDGVARAHKNHDLFVLVFAKERKKQLKFARRLHHAVALLKPVARRLRRVLACLDEHWIFKGEAAKVFHLFGHRGTEERSHSGFGRK